MLCTSRKVKNQAGLQKISDISLWPYNSKCAICKKGILVPVKEKKFIGFSEFSVCNNGECASKFEKTSDFSWALRDCKTQTKYLKKNSYDWEWQTIAKNGILNDERKRIWKSSESISIQTTETKPLKNSPYESQKEGLKYFNCINQISISPKGQYFAILEDKRILIFNKYNGKLLTIDESVFYMKGTFQIDDKGKIFYQTGSRATPYSIIEWFTAKLNEDLNQICETSELSWFNTRLRDIKSKHLENLFLTFSPNYNLVAFIGFNRGFLDYIGFAGEGFSWGTNKELKFPEFSQKIEKVEFSQDGKILVAFSNLQFDIIDCSQEPTRLWSGDWNNCTDVIVTKNKVLVIFKGGLIHIGKNWTGTIFIHDLIGNPIAKLKMPFEIKHAAVSMDGNVIFVTSSDNMVYAFTDDGTLLWKFGNNSKLLGIGSSANGQKIVVGSDTGIIVFDNAV